MRLIDQAPSENVIETFSYSLAHASLTSANIVAAALTCFAICVLLMMAMVVIELKEIDHGQEENC